MAGKASVRVFGPNLSAEGQRKGTFHVHAEGCGDIAHYGPGTRYGGDDPVGWLIEGDTQTVEDVAEEVYPPGDFDYDPATGIGPYVDDIYVAPCAKLKRR